MGMFDSYENVRDHYVQPNKPITPKPDNRLEPLKLRMPYEELNAKGELVGYYWYYGDTINLEFTIEGEVTTVDGEQYTTAEDFMKDKIVQVEIFNFRYESVCIKTFAGSTVINFAIDTDLSKKLVKGTYTCSLSVLNSLTGMNKTLIHQEDCTLIVK